MNYYINIFHVCNTIGSSSILFGDGEGDVLMIKNASSKTSVASHGKCVGCGVGVGCVHEGCVSVLHN